MKEGNETERCTIFMTTVDTKELANLKTEELKNIPEQKQIKAPDSSHLLSSTGTHARSAPKRAQSKGIITNTASTSPMVNIIEKTNAFPEEGDLIEGPVIASETSAIYVDLTPFGTGIIYGREYLGARDVIKNLALGDMVAAKIVERENEDGYIELSLKEARQALAWGEAEKAIQEKMVFDLPVRGANKGGLMLEWRGIDGFLPASQLKPEHYPKVEGGQQEKVFTELQKFVGTTLPVCILSASPKEGKLIFSEKERERKVKDEMVEKYAVGDVVEGEITGIVDFGLFVKIEDKLEGLVHISEMDWGLVEDPHILFKVGEQVKAQIIEIKDGKISLSIKALKENPWTEASKKYKKGDMVSGVVIKHNQHGALMSIEEGVAGLAHVSEFGTLEKLKDELELGKAYPVMITFFEPQSQRMTLSYKQTDEKDESNDEDKKTDAEGTAPDTSEPAELKV
jgi:small subunit ribosomal protein S1